MNGLNNKIALITGGNRGLGKNMAIAFAKNGADVIFTYRQNQEEATSVVAEIEKLGRKAISIQLEVGDSSQFDHFTTFVKEALTQHWNRSTFDFLINNAGGSLHAPFAQTTEKQFDEIVNVHFKGVYFLSQKLLPLITDGGRIVNLSSGLARFSIVETSVYGPIKGAIEVLTRYMAKELGARRIAVNAIAPGAIETDFGGGMVRDNKELNQLVASGTALGRVGVPDDIGGVAVFLCSEEGRWINAQRIEVAGGTVI
jgi:NAD(P)-dependent dehydrogenase (short-subunit alcohol dehydrogenase family)